MKIIVRKTPEYILDESFKQLDCFEVAYDGDAMQTYIKSLKMSNDEAHLNLEDDIILCDDFIQRVNEVISEYENEFISFFTLKNITTLKMMSGGSYCMAQCTYYPKGYSSKIIEFINQWSKRKEHPTGLDYALADFLKENKLKYLLWQPSLVQHRIGKSRIDTRRSSKRQSKTFEKENKNGSK